jgi:sulfur carrier protein ThiS adenylyltransferase
MTTREERYSKLIPLDRLHAASALIIGVGAVGRQVALQLATMGVGTLTLIDPDDVDIENLGAQGYRPAQLGKPKVEMTEKDCLFLNPKIEVAHAVDRFKEKHMRTGYIFCCVDSIEDRSNIFNNFIEPNIYDLFIDARMQAEVIRIITVDPATRSAFRYNQTLFEPDEAEEGECTARSIIYAANIAASLMLSQFTKHLREHPLVPDFTLALPSLELFEEPPQPVPVVAGADEDDDEYEDSDTAAY